MCNICEDVKIKLMNYKEGDVVIITSKEDLTKVYIDAFKIAMKEEFGNVKYLLTWGHNFSVAKVEDRTGEFWNLFEVK